MRDRHTKPIQTNFHAKQSTLKIDDVFDFPKIVTTRCRQVVSCTSLLIAVTMPEAPERAGEVMGTTIRGAVGFPESGNMLGMVPVLSTPIFTAIGGPHSRPQVSAKKKHFFKRIPIIEKRQAYM